MKSTTGSKSRSKSKPKRGLTPASTGHVYIKFRRKGDDGIYQAFGIGSDPDTIDLLPRKPKGDSSESELTEVTNAQGFGSAIESYVSSMKSFRRGVPAINLVVPLLGAVLVERDISTFVSKVGTLVRESSGENVERIYRIPGESLDPLLKRVDELTNLMSFSDYLPGISLAGLVSLYDGYISQLLRAYFNAVPAAISGSDKAITFKQISSFSSIDDARRHIIEKEVEGVIRNSHLGQLKYLEEKVGIPFRTGLNCLNEFVEICERRNLYTA